MWTGLRVSRPVLWRLVLVTVLAGLLHLLGCAHGAQAAGLPRADSLAAVSASACPHAHGGPAVRFTDPVLCDHGAGMGCAGVDEHAAYGPRADLPAPPAVDDGLLLPGDVERQSAMSRAFCGIKGGGYQAENRRTRAVLGVWRT